MKKKNKSEKVCPCGRIITDSNNKKGICPKCKKLGKNIVAGIGTTALLMGAKKYGFKILKGTFNIIKNIKK